MRSFPPPPLSGNSSQNRISSSFDSVPIVFVWSLERVRWVGAYVCVCVSLHLTLRGGVESKGVSRVFSSFSFFLIRLRNSIQCKPLFSQFVVMKGSLEG